jgi:glycosyltransferase involved in cell wall biosynthesis
MEAMSMGKPVLAHAVGGIPEMVEHGKTGLLATPNVDLADKLLEYARDAGTRDAHGKCGRERILQEFEAAKHARNLTAILHSVAARRSE